MASKDHARDIEEQYVLRVQDSELAERIRTALRSDPDESPHEATPSNNMQILFEGEENAFMHYDIMYSSPQILYPLFNFKLSKTKTDLLPACPVPIAPGDDDTRGKLVFEDQAYPLTVLNLPCVTESYKTYDDINLVKTTDIGQVLVVGLPEVTAAAAVNDIAAEVKDGITPPMRNARQRMFRKPFNVAPSTVHDVEQQMLAILHVGSVCF